MKRFFVGGLAALLPTILTLWILTALVGFVRNYIAIPVTRAIHWTLITNQAGKQIQEYCTEIEIFTPEHALVDAGPALAEAEARSAFFLDLSPINRDALYADLSESIPPYIGLALSFVLIFVAGFLLRNYFVKLLFRQGERILQVFPLVRSIYKNSKKLVDFLFSGKEQREFKGVVAVPYPSPGIFTVGFVTSAGLESLNAAREEEFVSVFWRSRLGSDLATTIERNRRRSPSSVEAPVLFDGRLRRGLKGRPKSHPGCDRPHQAPATLPKT